MITKERLEELIKEEKGCWVMLSCNIGYIHLNKKYDPQITDIYFNENELSVYLNNDLDKKNIIPLDYLYETKEEVELAKEDAEFVLRFHTSKTFYFEPPTWEEFLKTETDELKPNYTCENLVIVEDYNEIIVEDYNNDLNEKHFSYNKELNNRKEKYYKAVEYAKKLFLGEEECLK